MVEDEVHDAILVQHVLKKAGFDLNLKRVETRDDFLHELSVFRPSLILSDHGSPAFDGFAALRLAQKEAPEVPFIFVTGPRGEEVTARAFKSGAADFVLKHQLETLPVVVNLVLRQAEDRRRQRNAEAEPKRLIVELQTRLADKTAELEAAQQELEAFSYSVSHDLRAPLRHIQGFVEILGADKATSLDEESQKHLATIANSARLMERMIDDLLGFSRAARAEVKKRRIPLSSLVRTCLRELEPETKGRRVEWVVPELPAVYADPTLLRTVLLNLLGNALKFTRPRRVARIQVGCRTEPGGQIIFVRDNGVGFDPAYADKLFGVFQRLHRAAEFEGAGIGLANVRRIICRHGGRTWAEGEVDKGASFFFALPGVLEQPSSRLSVGPGHD